MSWNKYYWEMVDQYYWSPKYLGLTSINKRKWDIQDDVISVPRELVNESGPLYTRGAKIGPLIERLHGMEEMLNDIFNITFAIAPDKLITELFVEPCGLSDHGPFESLGRDIRQRFVWGDSDNVTQIDGLFVGSSSILGIELKLGSSSWPEQIAKYVAVMVWEELNVGPKDQLGLLYVVPENALDKHWTKCGLPDGPVIDRSFMDTLNPEKVPSRIAKLFEAEPERVRQAFDRLQLSVITWREIRDKLAAYKEQLNEAVPAEQTLLKLIDGFLAQLAVHKGTGLN